MKAVILAAGRGSRLEELTKDKPKCLYKFAGKTLLQWQVEALQTCTDKVGVVVGYKSEKINIPEIYKINNANWMNSNMIRSLFRAAEWVGDEECILSYSDIVYSRRIIEVLKQNESEVALTYTTRFKNLWVERFEKPLEDLESFKIKDGYIYEIGKKVDNIDDVGGQYMGLVKFGKAGLSKFVTFLSENFTEDQIDKLDFTKSLNRYIENGGKVRGIPTDELWLEFDTIRDTKLYKKYELEFVKVY